MKSLSLIMGVAGLILVSIGAALASDAANAPRALPVKKDSGHGIPASAAKDAAPSVRNTPGRRPALQSNRAEQPKPNLPIDAGRKQGTANIGGPTGATGHKNGKLNGTEIKRHP
jgi:hypothetical protein